MATDVQIALQPQAGQDPAAALTAAAAKLVRASIETLIQQAGQPMTGKIIAPPPNLPSGLAQIAVADQILTLKLSLPLPTGTAVRIEVQPNAGGQPSVSVQQLPTRLPVTAAPMPAPRAPTPLPLPPAPQQAQTPTSATTLQAAATPAPAPTNPTPAPAASQPRLQPAAPAPPPQAPMPQPAATTTQQQSPTSPPAQPQPATPLPATPTAGNSAPQPATNPGAPSPVVATRSAPSQPTSAVPMTSAPAPSAPAPSPAPAGAQPSVPQAQSTPAATVQTTASATTSPPAAVPASPAPAQAARQKPVVTAQPTQPSTQPQPAPVTQPQTAVPPQVLMQRLTQAFAPPPSAATPAPTPGSPAQLVMAAATQAAAQQQSPGPLLQALAVRLPHLPAPVAEAANKVLASRISLDRGAPAGAALKQAVLGSGVFLNAPVKTGAQPDLRQALTQLRGTLMAWLGDEIAPVAPVVRRPPPPTRGAMPRGQAPELPQAPEGSARDAGRSLLSQTEGALSRVKLMQLSTHGAEPARSGAAAAPTEWNLELPITLGHELAMAQIQINRDAKGKADPKEKNWRLRFAMKFSVLGEVGAQVTMVGKRTSIAIWADQEATAETLEAMLPELAPALVAKGLELVSLTVRRGVPRDENQPSGRLMDSMR